MKKFYKIIQKFEIILTLNRIYQSQLFHSVKALRVNSVAKTFYVSVSNLTTSVSTDQHVVVPVDHTLLTVPKSHSGILNYLLGLSPFGSLVVYKYYLISYSPAILK